MMMSNSNKGPTTEAGKRASSALTFAVIWDPEQGLETFSGGDLLSQESTAFGVGAVDADRSTVGEPFAVFGSRQTHFIDVRSSSAYGRYLRGDGGFDHEPASPVDDASSVSTRWSRSSFRGTLNGLDALDANKELPPTPSPKFNLAALLDPETGFLAYRNSKIAGPVKKFFRSASAPASASPCSEPEPEPEPDYRSGSASPEVFYDSRETEPRPASPVPAQLHCTNPDPPPTPRPPNSMRSFSEPPCGPPADHYGMVFDQMMRKRGVRGPDETHSIDDEGFFETSSHPDCEPHLPSRFSTTTTSTSTYITIDSRTARCHTPVDMTRTPTRQRAAAGRYGFRPKTSSRLIQSISFPSSESRHGSHHSIDFAGALSLTHPRLSNIFRRPWSRRTTDDRWVLIEVRSVVTERVIDD
ncbi:unnamed protein product [Cyclocybe aegerita]|uniref:Uncharacterized protein n=1 Tax=Cyclocybe aegerita TaxID=1973307 RepID=A0A8S0W233_CYCAE|nr:unnamed protein product [Cyclocybe aegerita]